ncbi:MAG: 4-hydroxythreonine-4-phosphate dehydrogenase PdxA [Litorimonas sp.]
MTARPLILSMGDPAGIGPEITLKAWQALKSEPQHSFAISAPPSIFSAENIDIIDDISQATSRFSKALPVLPLIAHSNASIITTQPSSNNAPAITSSIEQGVKLCLSQQADALITNPIAKDILYKSGFQFPGHTEYLGALTQDTNPPYNRGPVMMLTAQDLRVGLVTVHLPLKEVPAQITTERIVQKARVMLGALKVDFGIARPRLAICGLNPHAGESGTIGREDIDIINPAAQILRDDGHDVTDAQSADTLFHSEARQGYDAVLAMYHDQGLIPVKTLDFHGGVNVTLGLPIIRSSPDHGTAFGIAGKNIARPDSLIAAIRQARIMANNRHGQ